jgi:membrane-bound lytic murein transglycosylase B
VLGVVVLGAVGAPVDADLGGGTTAPAARAVSRDAARTAADVVLRVSAEAGATAQVGLPGTVEGMTAVTAAATAASVLPPGLTGPPGTTGPLGVPDRVLTAYLFAEQQLARTHPGCAMPWWLLAGIGKVESGHAGGGRVDRDGRTRGEVLGPLLDGSLAGTMVIPDTDGGLVDGNTEFDRAVGPMQFLPGTWAFVGTDADRDRTADPHDVDDAATTAGVYLCRGGGSMTEPEQLRSAVLRYNGSEDYVDAVLAWGTSYRDRVVAVPGETGVIAPPAAPVPTPAVPVPTTPAPVPTTTRPTPSPTRPTAPPTSAPPTTTPTTAPTTDPAPEPTGEPTAAPSPEPTGDGPTP